MSIVEKALWIIERNSARDITLMSIAEACGVSRSHLANAFGSATGVPVVTYLRGRRLTQAAHRLADGARNILTVALDAGYGSHEAFTRAFREQFGLTPEAVRDAGAVSSLAIVAPMELKSSGVACAEPPRFVSEGVLRIVGLREPFTFETLVNIPAQWQRFMAICATIPDQTADIPVGVTQTDAEDGGFTYMCGVEVRRFGARSPGLTQLEIAARTYAVFEHRQHVSKLFKTYAWIWNAAIPATGRTLADAPVIERHNDGFDPGSGEGGVTVWIPLEE